MLEFLCHDLYQIFLIIICLNQTEKHKFQTKQYFRSFTHYQGVQYDNFRTTNHFTIYRLF